MQLLHGLRKLHVKIVRSVYLMTLGEKFIRNGQSHNQLVIVSS